MMEIEKKFLKAYDKYAPAILRHIFFRVSDRYLAENLAQDTFFKAWKNVAADGKNIENYKSFFYKIANNLIIDHYRSKARIPLPLDSVREIETAYDPPQEKEAERIISGILIEKYLEDLEDDYRQIIILRYIDELDVGEICEVTGKTPNHVSVMIHRGLKMLRKKIDV